MTKNSEIIISGVGFDTGCRVITWEEEKGLSFYDKKKGYTPYNHTYNELQNRIKAFYIHHSVTYRARPTFLGLQALGLSCVFMIDDDINLDTGCATIYQCLDVKEGAYTQGGIHNHDGAGVEICYYPDAWTRPPRYSKYNRKRFNVLEHNIISDKIHGKTFKRCYGPTKAQIKACEHLACAYLKAFPNIKSEFPKDDDGNLITTTVPLEKRNGLLHHYHVKRTKIDAMGFPTNEFELHVKEMIEKKTPMNSRTFIEKLKNWLLQSKK